MEAVTAPFGIVLESSQTSCRRSSALHDAQYSLLTTEDDAYAVSIERRPRHVGVWLTGGVLAR
jgi:hypothetical protein